MGRICRLSIIGGLVLVATSAVVGIVVLGMAGRPVPAELPLLASTAVGALAGSLTLTEPGTCRAPMPSVAHEKGPSP